MVSVRLHDYGLELTQNSKVGWAFSLSRSESCINATDICTRLCYGNGVRYQTEGQRHKRLRNFKTCEFLLQKGGPELLAQNLVALVDQARPVDWLAAQISGESTNLPYSLRVHDVGDYFCCDYARAWLIAIKDRPQCKFWFYTRSFLEPRLLAVLSELASEPNCQGFSSYPGVWKLALMQQEQDQMSPELLPAVRDRVKAGEIINFPYHRAGKHVQPLKVEPLTNCPQITTSAYPLQTNRALPKPCQSCSLCLPG
jgi:hypothetical protein